MSKEPGHTPQLPWPGDACGHLPQDLLPLSEAPGGPCVSLRQQRTVIAERVALSCLGERGLAERSQEAMPAETAAQTGRGPRGSGGDAWSCVSSRTSGVTVEAPLRT